jgi:hypothetical protein
MSRAAAARKVRLGLWVTGSIGVDTLITAASSPSRGSSAPTKMREPISSAKTTSTPGSKMCGRPRASESTTLGWASTPYTVWPARARAAARVRPT